MNLLRTKSLITLPSLGGSSTGGLTKAALIARLTTLGAVACYLPSEYSTTAWQRYDATTERGMIDYPVGFLGDILQGMSLGPELVTNGDFSQGTDGWNVANAKLSVTDGVLMITTTNGTIGSAYQPLISTDIPAFYAVDGDSIDGTGLSQAFVLGCTPVTAAGFAIIRATSSPIRYNRRNAGAVGTYSYHDNCTLRRLFGRHSTQPTESSRPTLRYTGGLYYLDTTSGQSLTAYVPASVGSTVTVIYANPGVVAVVVTGVAVTSQSLPLPYKHSGLVIMPSTASTEAVAAVAAMVDVLARRTVV